MHIGMKLWSLLGNSQRLDGGAMFGNVPRGMWEHWIEPDAENRIPLACRCLLAEGGAGHDGDLLLFEQAPGKGLAVNAGAGDVDHGEHAAFRLRAAQARRIGEHFR